MSYYESYEQRQIRSLRNSVAAAEQRNRQAEARNQELQNRIRQNENERRRTEERFNQAIARQQQQIQAQERRNQQLNHSIQNLDREIHQQEQAHNQRLRQMQQQHQRDIQQQNERFDQESRRLQNSIRENRRDMEKLRSQTQEQFETMQAQRQRDLFWTKEQIQNANQRISNLEQQISSEKERQSELASYWISQAQRLADEIRENYRPDKFEPEKWNHVQQNLINAQNDFRAEMFQISVGYGRASFQAAYELRDSLIEQELEWQSRLEAARKLESTLLENLVSAESRVYTFEIGNEKIEDNKGVDYWTYGRLSEFVQRMEQTRNRLNADTQNLTTEELTALESELHDFISELALLENTAETNLAMARSRLSMAERIGQVLGDHFQMDEQDGDYFASENRDEYHASFTNPATQEQAVVVITPIMEDNGIVTNHAEVLVSTPSNSPDYRQEVNRAVVQDISRDVPDFKLPCSEQYAEHTNQEAERLGNISAVSEGREAVRSQCSISGTAYNRQHVTNPAASAKH